MARRLIGYLHIIMKKCVKKLSHHHFTLITYQLRCQSSILVTGFRIGNIICKFFGGFGFHRLICLKKAYNIVVFGFSPFWNLNFKISKRRKEKKSHNFWSFWDMIWPDVSFLSLDHQFISHLWASFHAKFVHTDNNFNPVTNVRGKKKFLPLCLFFKQFKAKYFNLNCSHI